MIISSNPLLYNGNISSKTWATSNNRVQSAFVYEYDRTYRLTKGEYYEVTDNGYTHDGSYEEKILIFDENENIKTMIHYGEGNTPFDLLSFTYLNEGNQISYIVDPTFDVASAVDYPGGTSTTQVFQYDQNGNMTIFVGKRKNTPVLYNYLNKPEVLDFGNVEKIICIYDGAGTRLAKIVKDGDALPESFLIYSGNFVYDLNQNLKYIFTTEGRLVPENNSYQFEYGLQGLLGNTRATYVPAMPSQAQVAEYQHYYPYGMQVEALCKTFGLDLENNYLYNGKELQMDFGFRVNTHFLTLSFSPVL